jgi:hypothetical protein
VAKVLSLVTDETASIGGTAKSFSGANKDDVDDTLVSKILSLFVFSSSVDTFASLILSLPYFSLV